MESFKGYLIEESEGRVQASFADLDATRLDPGNVVVRVAYSSVNYKDALAATGAGRIIRRFPCVGGIDLAGIVETSADPRFSPGDAVLATGYDLGVAHHGGYAQYARLPGDWLFPLPRWQPPRPTLTCLWPTPPCSFCYCTGALRIRCLSPPCWGLFWRLWAAHCGGRRPLATGGLQKHGCL